MMQVRLFGRPRIDVNGERIETRLSTQGLLLFAMLVTHPDETLDREEVAYSLWPDTTDGEARAALRRQLYKLQRALPGEGEPWIFGTAKTIRWNACGRCRTDVTEFERYGASPETIHAAIALYTADFAPSLDHEWAAALRERLRKTASRCLEQLIARSEAAGDRPAALAYVEKLLAFDPWREDAVRRLMILRCSNGDRAGAVSCYRRFSELMREELGVEPMLETLQLNTAICRGEVAVLAPA
jgi:DNA-binding SARP family transcriptional activator